MAKFHNVQEKEATGLILLLFLLLTVRTEIMSHVPRRISAACALFLQHHGSIRCKITGIEGIPVIFRKKL